MRKRFSLIGLICILVSFSIAGAEPITAPIMSDFDSGLEGWTGNATWGTTNGNPNGYAKFVTNGAAPTDIIAPAKFLGDWSKLDGTGKVSFNHALFDLGGGIGEIFPYSIELAGPGGKAVWEGPTPSGITSWLSFDVLLDSDIWTINDGNWTDLLNDVQSFRIRIELVSNSFGPSDRAGIDNVYVGAVPLPSAVLFFSIGLFGLAWLRRWEK